MPVTSTRRYSTTIGSSSLYSPSTSIGSYRTTTGSSSLGNNSYTNSLSSTTDRFTSYRSSSSYRNDTTPTTTTTNNTSRYGVSKYIPRSSVDKELLPPTGHTNCNNTNNNNRFVRSESRIRDKSLDLDRDRFNYLRSDSVNALKSLSSSSSFARTVATTGADFYEKYSPSRYIPKCELSRSRSLSEASKLNLKDSATTTSNYSSSAGGATAASTTETKINLLPTTLKVKLNEKNLNNNLFVGVNTINTNNQAFGLKNKILSKKLKTGIACAAQASNLTTINLSNTKKKDQLIGTKINNFKKVTDETTTTTTIDSKMINNNSKISYNFKNRTGLGPKIDSTFLLSEYELAKSQINKLNNNNRNGSEIDKQPVGLETELEEITKKILKKNEMNCLTSSNDDLKFIDSNDQNDLTTSMTLTTGTTTTILPLIKLNSLSNCKKENGGIVEFNDEQNVSFSSFFFFFCFKNAFLFFFL